MKALPLVRHNIIANYSGRILASLLSLAFVPLYIKLMGVQVYGLLGIFMSLNALLALLDMGLSATRRLIEDNIRLFNEFSQKPYLEVTPWLVIRHKVLMTYRVWVSRKFITRETRRTVLTRFGIRFVYR